MAGPIALFGSRFRFAALILGLGCANKSVDYGDGDDDDDIGIGDTDTNDTDDTDDTGDTDDTDDTDSSDFDQYIFVDQEPSGNFDGFDGYEAEGGWWTQNVDTSQQEGVPLTGEVVDFQTDDPVAEASVDLWFSDVAQGPSDISMTAGSDGSVSGMAYTCTPTTYLTATDPDLDETKDTYQSHNIWEAGDSIDEEFNSVSIATYQLIPALLGVSPDSEMGIVTGWAYDLDGEPVEGLQVLVRNTAGDIPDSVIVRYFYDDFPSQSQEWTSEDGLWIAINVPVGESTVEMYGYDGAGGYLLLGATEVIVHADSINISNVYGGYGDGMRYPGSCLE